MRAVLTLLGYTLAGTLAALALAIVYGSVRINGWGYTAAVVLGVPAAVVPYGLGLIEIAASIRKRAGRDTTKPDEEDK